MEAIPRVANANTATTTITTTNKSGYFAGERKSFIPQSSFDVIFCGPGLLLFFRVSRNTLTTTT